MTFFFADSRRMALCEFVDEECCELPDVLPHCPACTGRGFFVYRDMVGFPAFSVCPCGGTEEDRIDLDDFDGAA